MTRAGGSLDKAFIGIFYLLKSLEEKTVGIDSSSQFWQGIWFLQLSLFDGGIILCL